MDKKFIWAGLGIVFATVVIAILLTKSSGDQATTKSPQITSVPTISQEVVDVVGEDALTVTQQATQSAQENVTITPVQEVNELIIEDLVEGTGDEAVSGKKVTVNYKGTLVDGTQFDSSYGGQPFSFTLGAGQVIEGWDQGFAGMKVGGKRKLTIPPKLGYGSRDMGTIPPNSVLIFEVELLDIE